MIPPVLPCAKLSEQPQPAMSKLASISARPWRALMLASLLIAGWGCSDSFAQGSTGGIIGKENKSVSGTRDSEPEQPMRRRSPGQKRDGHQRVEAAAVTFQDSMAHGP